ncbi:MAG: hypothetical protein HC804_05125 [Anaerolineae bacterium]|nr:hypothetical protein [Anaerolineae bacterium]
MLEPLEQEIFGLRLEQGWDDVHRPLRLLYGNRPDFETWINHFIEITAKGYAARPSDLRHLDLQRVHQPDWFQHSDMVGYVAYTERFAQDLPGVSGQNPLFERVRHHLFAPHAAAQTTPSTQ